VSTITVETAPARPAEVPRGQILLEPPPELPDAGGDGMTQALVYLPMAAMAIGTGVMLAGGHAGPISYVGAGAIGIGMAGMMGGQLARRHSDRKLKLGRLRRDYLRYLSQVRARARAAARLQREAAVRSCPPPAALPALVAARKIWDRVPGSPGFLDVRFGTGPGEPSLRLVLPEATGTADDLDPLTTAALHRFVRVSSVIPALPATIQLSGWDRITLTGDPAAARDLARAVVAQLAVTHSPADVLVTVCADGARIHEWEWAKWLPHTMHPKRADAAGAVRLMTPDPGRVPELLGPLRDDRTFHVIIADGPGIGERLRMPGAVVLDVTGASAVTGQRGPRTQRILVLRVTTDSLTGQDGAELGLPDAVTRAAAESLARQLAPLRPAPADGSAASARAAATLAGLLGVADPRRPDPAALRQRRSARDLLRVPIGTGTDGSPVELDIKESAQGGMGPHGLIVGATGSGKSELLRTLVLGLTLTHDPGELNFVLVDFKGGATFLGMDALPHVSAVITNLADELPLVDRMHDALSGELVRRQEILRAAGHTSLREHHAAGQQLPALFLVLDEFSEMLSAKPEFAELFVTIGRVGRSLGIHLLLASQRLEEGKLRGLDTQLSYRIGLRTFNALESRTVLGVPDAYELPAEPGHGYLKADGALTRFRAAYVSGPVPAPEPAVHAPLPVAVEFGPAYAAPRVVADKNEPQETESFLRTAVAQLACAGPAARKIWLPPLAEPPPLDQLPRAAELRAAVGVVDKPFEQRRDPLWADLSGAGGHAAVVGAPRTGKSVLLRALVSSLALGHTPDQARFYILDFGGGTLAGLDELPHVGGVATRLHADRVRRTVAELRAILEQRERAEPAQRADVFLVVDGWLTLQQEFEDLEPAVTALAARGLGYGVHVIASAGKWSQFRPAIRDLFGTRLELRLGDPYESEAGRAAAGRVPAGRPGRGLTSDALHFLAAVPRTDGVCSADGLPAAAAELVKELAASWTGPAAPAVRLLPDSLPVAALPAAAAGSVPFGIDEDALAPVRADFTADPHFMIFGDTECGKSNLLCVLCAGLMSACTPQQARLVFVDYRRSLLELTGNEHSIGYATSSVAAARLLDEVRDALVGRLPPPDLPLAQLRSRSWWSGADVYVVVDDYDLVASGPGGGPLGSLLELLPQAADIGFHLILARSAGGAGRAMFDPVIQRLREMGTPGMIMSGNPDEGALFGGVRPAPLPPGRGVLVRRRTGNSLVQVARSAQVLAQAREVLAGVSATRPAAGSE
jgi:DNA segregation ATPase FtsK/SpoIIIE, S-DNA-T family